MPGIATLPGIAGEDLNRCERVTVVMTQDWYFYEKGILYCKLTVGFRRWNLQLLVSFGAVRSCCCGALKKVFLYRIALHELKKQSFSAKQKFSIYRKLYVLPSKASRFRNQNTACSNNFLLSSKTAFLCAKSLLFAQTFPCCYPKQSFSALRLPFARPLTYCLQRIQLFFWCSLWLLTL